MSREAFENVKLNVIDGTRNVFYAKRSGAKADQRWTAKVVGCGSDTEFEQVAVFCKCQVAERSIRLAVIGIADNIILFGSLVSCLMHSFCPKSDNVDIASIMRPDNHVIGFAVQFYFQFHKKNNLR